MDIQWYPGHMAKTRRLIRENLHLIDLVLELVDARAPYSTHLPDLKELIGGKPMFVVINKADLAQEAVTSYWIDEFKALGLPATATDSLSRKGLGSLKNALKKTSGKTLTRCLILGVPNVGKSFFINQLIGRRAAKIGDRPGVTKGKMWLKLDSSLAFLDTPGVLWPKFQSKDIGVKLSLIGSIKQELLRLEELATILIGFLNQSYPGALTQRYGIESSLEPSSALKEISKKRGFLLRGGKIDTERGAKTVINEFQQGRLGRISLEGPNISEFWEEYYQ